MSVRTNSRLGSAALRRRVLEPYLTCHPESGRAFFRPAAVAGRAGA